MLFRSYAVSLREINMGPDAGMFKFNRSHLKLLGTVRAVATPNMSPATKRAMIVAAKAQGLMPPYATARDEASSRQVLISHGLEDLERMIAEQSEPLEKVLELAREEARLAYQGSILQMSLAIQNMMQPPQQPSPEGGAPETAAPQMPKEEMTTEERVSEGRQQIRSGERVGAGV